MEHFRRNYVKLMTILNIDIIHYNDKNHFVNNIFNEKFSLMFEKSEMKKVIEMKSSSIIVSVHTVMIDELYDHLEGDSILRTILDFDEDIYIEEIVNMNIAKKRKFDQSL